MNKKKGDKRASHIPNWSWAVAAAGLLLVLGTVGFFLYQAVSGDDAPPEVVIETGAVVVNDGGYLVPIRVTNRGGEVASALLIEGALKDGARVIETSSLTFDYVPVGSVRRGGLIFNRDPRNFALQVQAKGYSLP